MKIQTLLSALLKQTFHEYIPLETTISDHTIACTNGELISVIKVSGVNNVMSGANMQGLYEDFAQSMAMYLGNGSHQVQITFNYDPDNAKRDLNAMLRPCRDSFRAMGLNDEILIDSTIDKIAQGAAEESCHIILYTTFEGLTKVEAGVQKKNMDKRSKDKDAVFFGASQNLFIESGVILQRHESFVDSIYDALTGMGVFASTLDVHDAIRVVREHIEAEFVHQDWQPTLVGDKLKPRNFDSNDTLGYPRISEQLLTSKVTIHDTDIKHGSRIYRPFLMNVAQRDEKFFSTLFYRMPVGIPWRLSLHLQPKVTTAAGLKIIMANMTSWMMSSNTRIRDGWKYVQELEAKDLDTIVGLRLGGMTWAKTTDELDVRFAQVVRTFEGWGDMKVSADSNDPFETFLAMAPALSRSGLKSSMPAAPLREITPMFPLFRPSLPWDFGGMIYTSLDGRPLPVEMASSIQSQWNTLISAPPGSGKSVLMLNMVLALIGKSGHRFLPKIGIIDIGTTSKGLINMLKFLLPKKDVDLVGRYRLQYSERYSINPLDTFMGKREPLSLDREFAINVTTMLCTPSGREKPYPNTSEVVGMAVDAAFRFKANEGAVSYSPDINDSVDSAIKDYHIEIDEDTTWWELVDALFLKGQFDAAATAQRYAVPLLGDVARMIIQDQGIRDLYGTDRINGEGVELLHALSRNLTASLADFKIFNKPTMFNVDRKKIVALDLDEVAKAGAKKASVMYMVARHVLAKTYYFDLDHIPEFPEIYHDYYEQFYLETKGSAKGLFMDEFHRTQPVSGIDHASEAVRGQVKIDMREGRKFNVFIVLASQRFGDFDPAMIDLASTRYILGYGSKKEVDGIGDILGLSDAARFSIIKFLTGASSRGSNLLINYKTKQGEYSQVCTFKCSSERLWFLSTTSEDQIVLSSLFKEFPQRDVIKFLSRKFPGGSAKGDIEASLNKDGDDVDITKEESRIAAVGFANELVSTIKKHGFEHA